MRMRINENNSWFRSLDGRNVLGALRVSWVSHTPNFRQVETTMEGYMEGYAALDFEWITYPIKIGDSRDQVIQ